jgi:NAD(P)-dependent dehydrogenase (short-subunit alcohol dehydrogenase family)
LNTDLTGKVALVTGAGSGIGRGAALELARAGARLGLLDRDDGELSDVCQQFRNEKLEAISLTADVSDPSQVRGACDKLAQELGRIDVVFANAGINGVWAPLDELEPEEWDRTLDINLKGTYLTIKYALPYLKHQGGSVVITSSVNGNRMFSNTGATAYSCSKAGQVAMTKMLAVELGPMHIRVNVICPGSIQTNISQNTQQRDVDKVRIPVEYPRGQIPLTGNKPGTVDETAQLVLFLASDASRHITGTEVYIDGAQSLLQG